MQEFWTGFKKYTRTLALVSLIEDTAEKFSTNITNGGNVPGVHHEVMVVRLRVSRLRVVAEKEHNHNVTSQRTTMVWDDGCRSLLSHHYCILPFRSDVIGFRVNCVRHSALLFSQDKRESLKHCDVTSKLEIKEIELYSQTYVPFLYPFVLGQFYIVIRSMRLCSCTFLPKKTETPKINMKFAKRKYTAYCNY